MKKKTAKDVVINLFRDVLESPVVDVSVIDKYIAPSYVQNVDGVVLDYDGFIEHMEKQKQVVASLSVEFLAIAEDGDTVFTNHIVTANKKDGSTIQVKVIAQFTVQNNRLTNCDELTRLLSGNHEDRDIGSRH
ncbi:nuclear transport factor 2 family protein [Desulfobulbus elongatus]|uniref:nuclear transport factor 2 family protein n=1 Tax=Desulfobulbus elongatus TaxID=53332 RepID=UPI000483D825|nr:nuclear transport factor 2 family protein [Desulfobulbus elongatus]